MTPDALKNMRTSPAENSPSAKVDGLDSIFSGRDRWWSLSLVLLTLAAYFPALRAGFIWNDADYLTKPALRSISGLAKIWTEPGATEQYYPVLHSFFWLEHLAWGQAPLGYHLVSVLLHALIACLLALVLRRLSLPGAWLAAFLFAIHPVCVESVAWIAEQKNTLSGVFFLWSMLVYLRFDEDRDQNAYRLAFTLFLLALGSKSLTATLPPALLVIKWWRVGRLEWRRDVVPLLPWFIVGALFGLFTGWVERDILLADGNAYALSLQRRCINAAHAIWFYLGKIFWPADLIFIYPRWADAPITTVEILSVVGTIGLIVTLFAVRKRSRAPLATFLLFIGLLFPVLGFFNLYAFLYSYVADHWQYLPSLAVLSFAAVASAEIFARAPGPQRRLIATGMGTIGVTLFTLTYRQSEMYHDVIALYRTTIKKNPACWMAYNNLGAELTTLNRKDEATTHYRRAVELNPDFASGYNNIGAVLLDTGNPAEAVGQFKRALAIDPDHFRARYNLASAYSALGQIPDAIRQLREALLSAPAFPAASSKLGATLAELGRVEEAARCYIEGLQLSPDDASLRYNFGNLQLGQGDLLSAIANYEHALRADPALAEAHVNCAAALGRLGRANEAIGHLEKALAVRPEFAEAHYVLALALRDHGNAAEARRHYEQARRYNPQLPPIAF